MTRHKYNRKSVSLVSLTDQATDIIPIEDAKAFLRIDGDDDDPMLTLFIGAAVDAAEKYLARAIRRQVLDLTMDGFPWGDDDALDRLGAGTFNVPLSYITGASEEFDLPYAPVNSITSITTYDTANAATVLSSAAYLLDNSRVVLNAGYSWPTSLRERAGVKVRYVAGYGPAALPGAIRLAIMQHVVAMYECRTGCEMPEASRGLMQAYRILDQLAW